MLKKPMTTEEFFDKMCEILKEKGMMPDILDYALATSEPVPMKTYEYGIRNNLVAPSVSDAVYDHLYDELQELEERTGIIYGNSPTQTVGYAPVSSLEKVRHPIPLLSLDKTKQTEELQQMSDKAAALLMLKLDGLTIKLCYENGELAEASTRGDGDMGELITHNIPAFYNVPMKIPYKGRLVITGEGVIHNDDFEKLKDKAADSGDKEICNARNLAAGSIRLLNPSACKERHIYFYAFNMIEGMEAFGGIADSRGGLLAAVQSLGVDVCPFLFLKKNVELEEIEAGIGKLKSSAKDTGLPIDGMVLRYDSIAYSKGCGRTGHHYKDGIAFKFEDDAYETAFRSVEWETGRSGEIAPVAVFDPVEIDGCSVSRASLHNLSFMKALELRSGCRVLDHYFNGDLQEFASAAVGCFDFASLPDFGETMSQSIWKWFQNYENLKLWKTLQKELNFEKREDKTMGNMNNNANSNPFNGCTIVATGKLENFTRDGINSKILSLGATAGSSVTRKTNYLICGEKPGSKLAKARELGVPVLTEREFLDMIPA